MLSITELAQLIKLPLLIEHYSEHKEKNANLSLWQFLSMHYSQADDNDGDTDKDDKLPFKSHDGCLNTVTVGFISNQFDSFFSVKPVYTECFSYLQYSDNSLLSTYHSSIWQPPKSC